MNQTQMFYQVQREIAERNEFFMWLSKLDNKPTAEELEKLKEKNPNWDGFKN